MDQICTLKLLSSKAQERERESVMSYMDMKMRLTGLKGSAMAGTENV